MPCVDREFPKRKHPRLKSYDYSTAGAYFITICTHEKRCILSRIVGRGLAPADTERTTLLPYGRIAEEQLHAIEERYPFVSVDHFVIMPNHIHLILTITDTAGASPRPTISDIICSYKSLVTRFCKKSGFFGKMFQTSFYEHIIRNREDYDNIARYIFENPTRWYYDDLYSEK